MFVDRRPLFFKINSICQFKDVFPKWIVQIKLLTQPVYHPPYAVISWFDSTYELT